MKTISDNALCDLNEMLFSNDLALNLCREMITISKIIIDKEKMNNQKKEELKIKENELNDLIKELEILIKDREIIINMMGFRKLVGISQN